MRCIVNYFIVDFDVKILMHSINIMFILYSIRISIGLCSWCTREQTDTDILRQILIRTRQLTKLD